MRAFFLLAGPWTLTACAAAPRVSLSGEGSLPLGPHLVPVVHAAAGEERFDVVLDSGSAVTMFDVSEARRRHLPVAWRLLPAILMNGADREFVWHTVGIERLELGAARIEALDALAFDVRALFEDAGAIAAVAGEDVLRSLVLVLDVARREVELVPAENREAALSRRWPGRAWSSLPLEYEGGCPVVELELEPGVTARLIVDTGAEVSVLPRVILERLATTTAGKATINGRVGGALTTEFHVLDPLELAGRHIALAVTDGSGSTGLLGMDVLGLLPVAIDGPGQRLWLGAPLAGENTRLETYGFQLARFSSRAGEHSD